MSRDGEISGVERGTECDTDQPVEGACKERLPAAIAEGKGKEWISREK